MWHHRAGWTSGYGVTCKKNIRKNNPYAWLPSLECWPGFNVRTVSCKDNVETEPLGVVDCVPKPKFRFLACFVTPPKLRVEDGLFTPDPPDTTAAARKRTISGIWMCDPCSLHVKIFIFTHLDLTQEASVPSTTETGAAVTNVGTEIRTRYSIYS